MTRVNGVATEDQKGEGRTDPGGRRRRHVIEPFFLGRYTFHTHFGLQPQQQVFGMYDRDG
jgi:hypothetical protein